MFSDGLDLGVSFLTAIKRLPETGAPTPRVEQQSVWDDVNKELLIYGGVETDYNRPRTWATYKPNIVSGPHTGVPRWGGYQ